MWPSSPRFRDASHDAGGGAAAGGPRRALRRISRRSSRAASSSASRSHVPSRNGPHVLLCDEPTGALDISTGIVVLEALAQVNAELRTTTVVITHNAAIAQMADRVVRLADGRITAVEGTNDESVPARPVMVMPIRISSLNRKLLRDLAAHEGAGARHRHGRRRRRVDVRDVPVQLCLVAADASGVLQPAAVCRRVCLHEAGARTGRRRGSRRFPDVSALETRVVANVTLDLAQLEEPASGRLISIPADRRPRVNDLFLRRGRWIEPGRRDEVLASEGFVIAHGLNPGDQIPAVINGRLRRLTIVGVALSPEYIYTIRPGELVPDDKRFGIFWMDRAGVGGRLRHGRRLQ